MVVFLNLALQIVRLPQVILSSVQRQNIQVLDWALDSSVVMGGRFNPPGTIKAETGIFRHCLQIR